MRRRYTPPSRIILLANILKPSCSACTKSRRHCEWKNKDQEALARTREILPQHQHRTQLSQIKPAQVLAFINEREAYYFWTYRDEAALELAGPVKSSPWTRTMLQCAHTESFVLRSLVAIGALNKKTSYQTLPYRFLRPI